MNGSDALDELLDLALGMLRIDRFGGVDEWSRVRFNDGDPFFLESFETAVGFGFPELALKFGGVSDRLFKPLLLLGPKDFV